MADEATEAEVDELEAENIRLRKELRDARKGKAKAPDPLARHKLRRDRLKIKKEIHELSPRISGKVWLVVLSIIGLACLAAAPNEIQKQVMELLSILTAAAVIYFMLKAGGNKLWMGGGFGKKK